MRNDTLRWAAPAASKRLDCSDLSIRQITLHRITMISGPYPAIQAAAGFNQVSGWPDLAEGAAYALRLRRDRVLVVDGPEMVDGWDADLGLAISDMTGAYAVFEIAGPGAMAFLRRGADISHHVPSASVNRLFHGLPAAIYTWKEHDRFRLHVSSPLREAFWMLAQQLAAKVKAHR